MIIFAKIVHLVGDIITGFLDALTAEIPRVVESIQNFIVTVVEQVAIGLNPATLMLMIGNDMLGGLLQGLKDKAVAIFNWFVDLGKMIIDKVKSVFGMNSPSKKFMKLGKDLITWFLQRNQEHGRQSCQMVRKSCWKGSSLDWECSENSLGQRN